jgi:hypothetical protein
LLHLFVIPRPSEARNPESILTALAIWLFSSRTSLTAAMDSGFALTRAPE